jgi:hypothetical protein
MTISAAVKNRLHDELQESFRVIDSCLRAYYSGETHMYRPLAGQLRIILCDEKPLLLRIFPTLATTPLRAISWHAIDDPSAFPPGMPPQRIIHEPGQELRLARMPFRVTRFANGLQVADLDTDSSKPTLRLDRWLDQTITTAPNELTVKDVIRLVADKGGGAHVDNHLGEKLSSLVSTGPHGVGAHQLLMVGFGRWAQELGLHYEQFREAFGYGPGRLQDVTFDPAHPSVHKAAKVPDDLFAEPRSEFYLTVLKRVA